MEGDAAEGSAAGRRDGGGVNAEAEPFSGWAILEEEWLPVVGFEGIYEVSSLGRVQRIGRAARRGAGRGGGARIGRIRKSQTVPGGYRAVQLWHNGIPTNMLVHVLVARAFLGEPPPGREVNHRSGDKTNNQLANLEYLTRSENNKHAYRIGLRRPVTGHRKLGIEGVALILTLHSRGLSQRKIAGHVGVVHSTVGRVLREAS